jgi:capsid protein
MIVPALPLLAQLRRYTLAVLAAAETAASHAGVVKTSTSPDADQVVDLTREDVPITAGTFNVLPAGWELQQLRAEQPTNTYRDFKLELIDEIARCVLTPRNISTGNSSGYNYSSGRLDHQTYDRMLEILRDELRACVLDQLFAAWLNEAVLVSGLMSLPVRQMVATGGMPSHRWLYRSRGHVDPGKEASATGERIRNGTSTLADECAAEGRDWEEVMEQRIREEQTEMRARERAGLPPRVTTHPSQTPQPAAPTKRPDPQDDQEDDQ